MPINVIGSSGGSGGNGISLTPTEVQTANYAAKIGQLVVADASGGILTVVAPLTPSTGSSFGVKIVDTSGGPAIVSASGTDLIGGPFGSSTVPAIQGQDSLYIYQSASVTEGYAEAVEATNGLVSYWRCNETSGTTLHDIKDSNSGTLPDYAKIIEATPGVAAYWQLNEAEGSVIVADSVGSYPGILSSGTLGLPGVISGNTALQLNNTGCVLVSGTSAILGGNDSWSIEGWVNTTGGGELMEIYSETGSGLDIAELGTVNSAPQIVYRDDPGNTVRVDTTYVTPQIYINDNNWHHMVGVKQGQNFNLYLDGVLVDYQTPTHYQGNSTPTFTDEFTNVPITDQIGLRWNGLLQDVAIYMTALSAGQVANHYASGLNNGLAQKPGALVGSGDPDLALSFGGSAATIPDATNLHLTGTMTIEQWARPSNIGGTQVLMSKISGSNGFEFGLSGAHLYFTAGGTTVTDTASVNVNAWNHVAVTVTGGNAIKFYVNGVPTGTGTTGTLTSSTSILYFGSSTASTNFFVGLVQEIAIYSTTLSASTIATHYADGTELSFGVWYEQDGQYLGALDNRYPQIGSAYINIKEYPYFAAGNGVTDDTQAFKDAINALSNGGHNGGTIVIPPGNYIISGILKLEGDGDPILGMAFIGTGMATSGPTLTWTGGKGSGPMIGVYDAQNITFDNISFSYNNLAYDGFLMEWDHGFIGADIIQCRLNRCFFKGAGAVEAPYRIGHTVSTSGGAFGISGPPAGEYTWWITTANAAYAASGVESSCPNPVVATITTSGSVTFSWEPTLEATAYNIYRTTGGGYYAGNWSGPYPNQIPANSFITTVDFNQATSSEWSTTTTYSEGQVVSRFSRLFISLVNNNLYNSAIGNAPEDYLTTAAAYWAPYVVIWTDTGYATTAGVPPNAMALLHINHAIICDIRDCGFNNYGPYDILFGPSYVNVVQVENTSFNNSRNSHIRVISGDCESLSVTGCTFEPPQRDAGIDGSGPSEFYAVNIENNWFGDTIPSQTSWLMGLATIGNYGAGRLAGNEFYGGGGPFADQYLMSLTGNWLVESNLFLLGAGDTLFGGSPPNGVFIANDMGGVTTTEELMQLTNRAWLLGNNNVGDSVPGSFGFGPSFTVNNQIGTGLDIIVGPGPYATTVSGNSVESLIYTNFAPYGYNTPSLRLQGPMGVGRVELLAGVTAGAPAPIVSVGPTGGSSSPGGVGFFGASPAARPISTSGVTGVTVVSGTALTVPTLFTGGVGTTGYTIDDIVASLKTIGLITS